MTDYAIITREAIRRKGAAAFAHGRTRESHGFNPGSAAIAEFQKGYDSAANTHVATSTAQRVELRQGVSV